MGSSPRTWGALPACVDRRTEMGIIPADAGSTMFRMESNILSQDHPRGCGEHRWNSRHMVLIHGLSPRMRGARSRQKDRPKPTWIIPADAGSTLNGMRATQCPTDHPRGCGEHCFDGREFLSAPGSSPRMRGAQTIAIARLWIERIIPADAGSTVPATPKWKCEEDHPRGCGEHIARNLTMTCEQGSSPRMRGARDSSVGYACPVRIIPADAGSTWQASYRRQRQKDHPRGCGEHAKLAARQMNKIGSSPRMRGALYGKFDDFGFQRIIPADAGSTAPSRSANA